MDLKNNHTYKLWTIQNENIYDELINNDSFTVKEQYVWKDYPKAYDFMIEEMKKRITGYSKNIKFPIWAWYIRDGKKSKPDLRQCGYANKGQKCICIELEVPKEEVLLSDFDEWHLVLMNCNNYNKTNIFNLKYYKNGDIKNNYVQATFWKIKKEYIKNIIHFVAK